MTDQPFGPAGMRLYDALFDPDDAVWVQMLVEEACRMVDRQRKLNAILSGETATWLTFRLGRESVIEVKVDSPLQESRQLTTVLRQTLAEIQRAKSGSAAPSADADVLAGL